MQEILDRVKHLLGAKDEREITPVKGVEGLSNVDCPKK